MNGCSAWCDLEGRAEQLNKPLYPPGNARGPEHRPDYAGISILYGATAPENFTYRYDVEDWQHRNDIELVLTIDRECEGWQCDVGLAPHVPERTKCGVGICGRIQGRGTTGKRLSDG